MRSQIFCLANLDFSYAAQHASPADQLSLALVWNRVDIAMSEIFVENQKWKVTFPNRGIIISDLMYYSGYLW
jgi:hypothetical protein